MTYGQACAPPKGMNAGGFSTEPYRDQTARRSATAVPGAEKLPRGRILSLFEPIRGPTAV